MIAQAPGGFGLDGLPIAANNRLGVGPFSGRCGMKHGARNQLDAQVVEIKRGTVMCHVKVKLLSPGTMSSVMTVESLEEMGLKQGDKVRVLAKAVNVLLAKE